MSTYYQGVLILIISSTCVALFVATAIAVVLDVFNLFNLRRDIRKKLHVALVGEVVATSVAVFGALLNVQPIADKVDTAIEHIEARVGDQKVAVRFSGIDTASAPGHSVAAAPYFHKFGISIERIIPSTSEVVLVNNRVLYKGRAVKPTISQNILTQVNPSNGRASFTLRFSEPLASIRFIRPALFPATSSGITHPAWSAHAFDTEGRELSSQSEGLIRSFSDVPARVYTLIAPGLKGISFLRFTSDPRLNEKPFAAFSAVLIEDLTMSRWVQ